MRRRTERIAGVMTAAIMAIGISVSTPVFAGTTLLDMAKADAERIDAAFTGKTLGNNDVAFVVYNTLAEETGTYDATDGRKTYNATINYRIYFNDLSEEGDNHAVSIPALVYRVIPSGTNGQGTGDVTKWPFPYMVNNYTQSKLRTMIKNNGLISDFLYYNGGDTGYTFAKTGNTPTMMDDLKEGIFSWKCSLDLQGEDGDRPYEVYETDGNGSYQHCYLTLNKIVGKPGDKIEVKIFQSYITSISGSSTSLRQIPYDAVNRVDRATKNDGIVVESGYIYIPYKVTYYKNGATGTTPTVTAGEIFTCDHNKVKVPGQGDMVRADGAEFLGWSATETTELVTDPSTITDLVAPGGTYEIPATKKEDVKLYAVWGKTAPEGATLNLETRGHKQGKVGSILDRQAFANGETPTYVNGSKFTLKKLDASGNIDNSFTPIESDPTGIDGKTKISGIGEGTYQLKQSGYADDWTNYAPSAWKVTVTKNGDDYSIDVTQEDGATEWQMKKDSAGNYTGNVFPIFDEWYWTKTARTKGTGSDPGTWEGFWEADANTLLIYNLGDGIVASGLNGQGGIPIWEWLLPGGIAGGIIVGIVVRYRMKRRHQ